MAKTAPSNHWHRRGAPRALALATGLLVLSATMAATSVAGGATTHRRAASPRISWSACTGKEAEAVHAQCGRLAVPVDWNRPRGKTIKLALLRVPASRHRRGTVLANSTELGGYGASEVAFFAGHAKQFLSRLPRAHQNSDIVTFDQRGFGASSGIHCPVAGHDPHVGDFPSNHEEFRRLVRHDHAVGAACHAASGSLLHHLDPRSQARDVEAIRRALGLRTVRWFGQGEGAALGAEYAARHPARVDAMVLDGTVDPARTLARRARDVAPAEEHEFNRFLAWCKRAPRGKNGCVLRGHDPARTYDRVLAKAARRGIEASSLHRRVTAEEIRSATGHLMLGESLGWGALATAIAKADKGDASLFGTYVTINFGDPDYTAYRAMTCSQRRPAVGYRGLRRMARRARTVAPRLHGASMSWDSLAGCIGWPRGSRTVDALPRRSGAGDHVLVAATTHDPVTPYPWGRAVARRLVGSRLLTVHSDGHTALDNSRCAAALEDRYLAGGRRPTNDQSCH